MMIYTWLSFKQTNQYKQKKSKIKLRDKLKHIFKIFEQLLKTNYL